MTPEQWRYIDRSTPPLALTLGVLGVGLSMMDVPPNKWGAAGSAFGSAIMMLAWVVTKVFRSVRAR